MIMEISIGVRTSKRIFAYEIDWEWWLKPPYKNMIYIWWDANSSIRLSEHFD